MKYQIKHLINVAMSDASGRESSMIRPVTSLALILLFISSVSVAQNSCPDGFRYAGTLQGSAAYMTSFSKRVEINLPENAMPDVSYQQATVRAEDGRIKEHSNLRPQDIPAGFHIVPYGSAGDGGWAVSRPELRVVEKQADGRITRYAFGMQLYCIPGHLPTHAACEVNVGVCYKPKM
jgi:hypothetical protein